MPDPRAIVTRVRAALDQAIAASGPILTAPINAPVPSNPAQWDTSGITIPLKEWSALCQAIWEMEADDG